jgi:hypothetical protein
MRQLLTPFGYTVFTQNWVLHLVPSRGAATLTTRPTARRTALGFQLSRDVSLASQMHET